MANLQHGQNYCNTILGDENGFIFAVFEENHRTDDQERQVDEKYLHNVAAKALRFAIRFASGQFVFHQLPGRQGETEAC